MSQLVNRWLQQIARTTAALSARGASIANEDARQFIAAPTADQLQFWRGVEQLEQHGQLDHARFESWLRALACCEAPSGPATLVGRWDEARDAILGIYRQGREANWARHLLLMLLLIRGGAASWQDVAQQIVVDPPSDPRATLEVFLAIWRAERGPVAALFPRLLDALEHPEVAPLVLDLANHLATSGRLPEHPARSRARQLAWLLRQLLERLEDQEQASSRQGVRDLELAREVHASITLAIALCHALALLDCREAAGTLHRLLELQHRRLRAEAAAALARFGDPAGIQRLVELAAEPVVRRRVVAYADELGLAERIAAEHRSPLALAEGELVNRLAEPDLFGVPPSGWELVDRRRLSWPGFDAPQDCFLFRYRYQLADGQCFTNLALVGPLAQALIADLNDCSPAEAYALYAGWHVEHELICKRPIDGTIAEQALQIQRSVARSVQRGFQAIELLSWGQLFERRLLIATAELAGQRGTLLVDDQACRWVPHGNPQRPLDADLAFAQFVGGQLLRQFNPEYADWPS